MKHSKERPWRRVISGSAAEVVPLGSWIDKFPGSSLGTIEFGEFAARNFSTALEEACDSHMNNEAIVKLMETKQIAMRMLLKSVEENLREIIDKQCDASSVENIARSIELVYDRIRSELEKNSF